MKYSFYLSYIFCVLLILGCSSDDSSDVEIPMDGIPDSTITYFPPTDGSEIWETKSVSELEWNSNQLQPLLDFLEEKHTKSFMILHNGKIVVESYLNTHTSSSPWY